MFFSHFPFVFWRIFWDGAQRGPHGSGVCRLALGNIGSRKCPGAVGGLHLALLCPCGLFDGATLKMFPQALLYLPRASLLMIGCRAGSAGFWRVRWLWSSYDLLVRQKHRDISRAQLDGEIERGRD